MTTNSRAPITDDELEHWARLRADDAGHLARELITYRRGDAAYPHLKALKTIAAPRECGCSPVCQCNTEEALKIEVDYLKDLALSALAPQAGDNAEETATFETCERCQGNGEIVTDWERYLHSHEGDKGDEAVTECPDCDGEGKLKHSTLATDEMVTAGCIAAYGEGFLNWPENSIRDGKMMVSRVLRAALASHPCTSTTVVSQNAPALEDKGGNGWQPIGTCPKNRSVIMQCWWKHNPIAPYVFEGYLDWDGVTWRYQDGKPLKDEITSPVYWRPMPTPALSTAPEAK